MVSISKPMYRSNPISAHDILFLLHSQPSPDLCTFINTLFSSFHFFHLSHFILLCFVLLFCFCNIYTEHVRTCRRSPHRRDPVCLCAQTQEYMHDVLRRFGPHSVNGCILNWISLLAQVCTRHEKNNGALKT